MLCILILTLSKLYIIVFVQIDFTVGELDPDTLISTSLMTPPNKPRYLTAPSSNPTLQIQEADNTQRLLSIPTRVSFVPTSNNITPLPLSGQLPFKEVSARQTDTTQLSTIFNVISEVIDNSVPPPVNTLEKPEVFFNKDHISLLCDI